MSQQNGLPEQMSDSQPASEQPRLPWPKQQSGSSPQVLPQYSTAFAAQNSSHPSSQQKSSALQTISPQASSSQPSWPVPAEQQSLDGMSPRLHSSLLVEQSLSLKPGSQSQK